MTLGSYIRTDAPVPPVDLLNFLTIKVGGDPATAKRNSWWKPEEGEIGNDLMQGFAAIVVVRFGLDGPLREEYLNYPDKDFPDDTWEPAPPAAVSVWLDTGYSYRDPETGENCEQLHRRLGAETAAWVRERFPNARCWLNIDSYGEWWPLV